MRIDPIVFAVPMYFVWMGIEAWVNHRRGAGYYRINDTLTNLACGVYQQVLVVVLMGILGAPYSWIYTHWRVTDWFATHSTMAWVAAFVGSDFFYYWFHRWSHESAIGWFSHVVHHQSEEYNLSVALRQDAWQPFFSLWFQLPLAVMGVPPAVFVTAYGLMIVYQFWIHTRFIGTLGPLEWLLNTPSHHRVHHGVNAQYLDKNYAGTFILWDRLFGTFQQEGESPTYGTLDPVRSFNPAWAHLHYGVKLLLRVTNARSLWETVQVLFRSPGWRLSHERSESIDAVVSARLNAGTYDVATPPEARRFAMVVFGLSLLFSLGAMAPMRGITRADRALCAVVALWGLANVGGIVESRAWTKNSQRVWFVVAALVTVAELVGHSR
jgi:alkylglycerol monooxygenase